MEKQDIAAGMSCFLVKDGSLSDAGESPIYAWLKEEGFTRWHIGKGGYSGVDWIYINTTSRVYAPGMPGVKIASTVGDHAITFDEFKTIYEIFKKYDGLDILRMTELEQKEWKENLKKRQQYWQEMSFERYLSEVRNAFFEEYFKNPSEEVLAYFNKEVESIRGMFKEHCSPEYAAWQLYFTM